MVLLGIIGEVVAAIVLIVAVTLQIQNAMEIANVLIGVGAVLFAIFTKIKLLGYEWDDLHNVRSKGRGRK